MITCKNFKEEPENHLTLTVKEKNAALLHLEKKGSKYPPYVNIPITALIFALVGCGNSSDNNIHVPRQFRPTELPTPTTTLAPIGCLSPPITFGKGKLEIRNIDETKNPEITEAGISTPSFHEEGVSLIRVDVTSIDGTIKLTAYLPTKYVSTNFAQTPNGKSETVQLSGDISCVPITVDGKTSNQNLITENPGIIYH